MIQIHYKILEGWVIVYESESNWSLFNNNLVDYVKMQPKLVFQESVSICTFCGITSLNPSSDHFFQIDNTTLCEFCYLDYNLIKNN